MCIEIHEFCVAHHFDTLLKAHGDKPVNIQWNDTTHNYSEFDLRALLDEVDVELPSQMVLSQK